MSAISFDRDQWEWLSRFQYADGTLTPWKLDKIVIHYGGYTDPGDGEEHEAAVLRSWQRIHVDTNGWVDIAYSFATGNTGLSYRLRGFNRNGATSGDFDGDGIPENHEALALVWIGGVPHEPSPEAYATMGRMIREVFAVHGEVEVTVHSDHKATGCPGDYWRAWRDRKGWEDDATIVLPPPKEEHQMRTIKLYDGYVSKGKEGTQTTVKAWQALLAHHGFADKKSIDDTCAADGFFGPGTEEATKDFQQHAAITIDGVAGPESWKAGEGV